MYNLIWLGLPGQAAKESKRNLSPASNSKVQRMLLLHNTYD